MASHFAVLTGDIVDSRSARDRTALYQSMVAAGGLLRETFTNAMPLAMDIFRGDSWQILLNAPGPALRAALLLRARIMADTGLDTRIGIGFGALTLIPLERTSEGDGPAYQRSGLALETLATGDQRLALEIDDGRGVSCWGTVALLLDSLVQNQWTQARARAVWGALLGWTQTHIADLWDPSITQPSVARHLARAAWPSIEKTLDAFELCIEGVLDNQYT